MEQQLSVFGLGYVGCVTAACFVHKGWPVIGVDVNPSKVEALKAGLSPVIEPGLEDLIAEGRRSSRLDATTDVEEAIQHSTVSFVCVGTPSLPSGKLDLRHIDHIFTDIGRALARKSSYHVIVLRSTVLPGTTESVVIPCLERASQKRVGVDFGVCYHPEFTREGSAVADFLQPPYTILGGDDPAAVSPLLDLYDWVPGRTVRTAVRVAEMVKYVSNAYHALKVAFANEVGTLCRHFGVDTEAVIDIFLSDSVLNVSPAYLRPGFAFGGSCLPKDLRALSHHAREMDIVVPLLEAVLPSNQEHLKRAFELIMATKKRKVALLGLSFKVETDDLRESPHVQLTKHLLGEGIDVRIWDPYVCMSRLTGANRHYIQEVIPHIGNLLSETLEDVVHEADVVILGTKAVPKEVLTQCLRPDQIVVDLVNCANGARPGGGSGYHGLCW